jgi:hypothetical protein
MHGDVRIQLRHVQFESITTCKVRFVTLTQTTVYKFRVGKGPEQWEPSPSKFEHPVDRKSLMLKLWLFPRQ